MFAVLCTLSLHVVHKAVMVALYPLKCLATQKIDGDEQKAGLFLCKYVYILEKDPLYMMLLQLATGKRYS